jgi:hypothetical protein
MRRRRSPVDLLDATRERGFAVCDAIMDKGSDNGPLHAGCIERGVFAITPPRQTTAVKRGDHKAPTCDHGEWKFAGTDYKRQATKWRCPTGECNRKSTWIKADRLHPLIPWREPDDAGDRQANPSAADYRRGSRVPALRKARTEMDIANADDVR